DEFAMRQAVLERTGLDAARLLINMSHTHAGPNMNSTATDKQGYEYVKPHLAHLANQIGDAILEARKRAASAWVAWGYGKSALAANRDYFDVDEGRWACGFNPGHHADDTLLVGRVTDDGGRIMATLVNYACHPTTLAWENHLLSPDYAGAMRAVLEREYGAPALFLQGASGDLAPRDNYVGDAGVADRNGRQLGFAAAAAIEALPPPGQQFVYTGIVESGTALGSWAYAPISPEQLDKSRQLEASVLE